MKSYREIVIPKDPIKERLKLTKAKLKQGTKLTQKEIEEAILDLIERLTIG